MSHIVAPETVMKAVHVVEVSGGVLALLAAYAGLDEYRTRKRAARRQTDTADDAHVATADDAGEQPR